MRIEQWRWSVNRGWDPGAPSGIGSAASLALVFGTMGGLRDRAALDELRWAHPGVPVFGCSTSSEPSPGSQSLAASIIRFDHSEARLARARVAGIEDSHAAGLRLALALPSWGLSHVLVLFDGLHVDGAALVRGLTAALPSGAAIIGAPSWDRERPGETLVVGGGAAESGIAAAVGLYGKQIRVQRGSAAFPFEIEERPATAVAEPDNDVLRAAAV